MKGEILTEIKVLVLEVPLFLFSDFFEKCFIFDNSCQNYFYLSSCLTYLLNRLHLNVVLTVFHCLWAYCTDSTVGK